MAESTKVKNLRDVTWTFKDGAGTPLTYDIAFESGDINTTIGVQSVDVYKDRGVLTDPPQVRFTEQNPSVISGTAYFRDMTDSGAATLLDLAQWCNGGQTTGYVGSSWTSTGMSGTGHVKLCTLVQTIEGSDLGDSTDHTATFQYCKVDATALNDGSPLVIAFTVTSYDHYYAAT